MNFPTHFPNGCPPSSAEDARGEVYRFVRNDPPRAGDFISHFVGNKPHDAGKKCQACGLSVLRSEQDVKEARRLSPWFKKRKVAKARLSPDWGKLDKTESRNVPNHHTWWVSEDKQPETIFIVIAIR
jgi:hypothetical protein